MVAVFCFHILTSDSTFLEKNKIMVSTQMPYLRAALSNFRLSPEILTKSNLSDFVR